MKRILFLLWILVGCSGTLKVEIQPDSDTSPSPDDASIQARKAKLSFVLENASFSSTGSVSISLSARPDTELQERIDIASSCTSSVSSDGVVTDGFCPVDKDQLAKDRAALKIWSKLVEVKDWPSNSTFEVETPLEIGKEYQISAGGKASDDCNSSSLFEEFTFKGQKMEFNEISTTMKGCPVPPDNPKEPTQESFSFEMNHRAFSKTATISISITQLPDAELKERIDRAAICAVSSTPDGDVVNDPCPVDLEKLAEDQAKLAIWSKSLVVDQWPEDNVFLVDKPLKLDTQYRISASGKASDDCNSSSLFETFTFDGEVPRFNQFSTTEKACIKSE